MHAPKNALVTKKPLTKKAPLGTFLTYHFLVGCDQLPTRRTKIVPAGALLTFFTVFVD